MKGKVIKLFETVSDVLSAIIHGIGSVIWNLLITVLRCPLFWVIAIGLFLWYIGTHPGEPVQYCPGCGRVR